jgi:hypothetical protein
MLVEVERVAQVHRSAGYRRWYSDEELDLIVWYAESGAIIGFQLCYDIGGTERAFTWKGDSLTHCAVDTGDESPLHNRSPILVSCPAVSIDKVLEEFAARSQTLNPSITALVSSTISSFKPRQNTTKPPGNDSNARPQTP